MASKTEKRAAQARYADQVDAGQRREEMLLSSPVTIARRSKNKRKVVMVTVM